MEKYDNASWHHDAANGDVSAMHRHTGFYLAWLAHRELLAPDLQENAEELLRHETTGSEFFQSIDGKFTSEDLSPSGNEFTKTYYLDQFSADYEKFCGGKENLYQVADTWENYEKLAAIFDQRFAEWERGELKGPSFLSRLPEIRFIAIALTVVVVSLLLAWLLDRP